MKNSMRFGLTILLLIASINLQSCAVGAVAGVAVTGAVLVYERNDLQKAVSDRHLQFIIADKIYDNRELYGDNHISVAVKNGTVLLIGQAQNDDFKTAAQNIAKNTEGVQRIYNEILIGPSTSLWRQFTDDEITSKVEIKILTKKELDPSAIKVVTEDAVVYLMGAVTPKTADTITNITRKISGVKKVVKVFQYIND